MTGFVEAGTFVVVFPDETGCLTVNFWPGWIVLFLILFHWTNFEMDNPYFSQIPQTESPAFTLYVAGVLGFATGLDVGFIVDYLLEILKLTFYMPLKWI